jgi:hypothetical protein
LPTVFWSCCAPALIACSVSASAAERVGIVTLLEGPAAIVRGATRYTLAEGVRVRFGDIIEVGDKGLVEVEFPEGTAFALGPGARMLAVAAARGKPAAGDYYVTRGALKLSRFKQGENTRFLTPVFTLHPGEGTAVMVVGAAEGAVFVEGGEARIIEHPAKGASPPPLILKSGEFYTRKADQKGAVAPRPSQAFVAGLPKVFFDPLPSRLARHKDRDVQPKRVEDVAYAEVEEWLKAPPEIRRPLMPRFRPRLADQSFRAALVANLSFHPEWDPILFPEKYKPKAPAASGSPATAGSGAAR